MKAALITVAGLFLLLLAPPMQAKSGWYDGEVTGVRVSGRGSVYLYVSPPPNDEGFDCRQSHVKLVSRHDDNDERRLLLALMRSTAAEALTTRSDVSLYMSDVTPSSGAAYCEVTAVIRWQPPRCDDDYYDDDYDDDYDDCDDDRDDDDRDDDDDD